MGTGIPDGFRLRNDSAAGCRSSVVREAFGAPKTETTAMGWFGWGSISQSPTRIEGQRPRLLKAPRHAAFFFLTEARAARVAVGAAYIHKSTDTYTETDAAVDAWVLLELS